MGAPVILVGVKSVGGKFITDTVTYPSYGKELKYINNNFETITGTVTEYTYVREGNSLGDPIQLKPVIKDVSGDKCSRNAIK